MKLHLPKLLLTAVLAACVAPSSWAATYSAVYKSGDKTYLHNYDFVNDSNSEEVLGWEAATSSSNQNTDKNRIIHFTSSTTNINDNILKVQFNNLQIGGIVVDSDTKVAGITYDGDRVFKFGLEGGTGTSSVNRDFAITPSSKLEFRGTQTWTIGEDATLTLGENGITTYGTTTFGGDGNLTFAKDTTLSGAGKIVVNNKLIITNTVTNNSTLELGGTVEIASLKNLKHTYTSTATGNGVGTFTTTWYLFDGTGSVSGTSTKFTYNNQQYDIADNYSETKDNIYAIQEGTVVVGGETPTDAATTTANGFYVAADATMDLRTREAGAAIDVDTVLKTTAGLGTINLLTTGTLANASEPVFEGKLKIGTGGVLQVGSSNFSGAVTGDWSVDLTNLAGIELAGGQLRFRGGNQTIKSIDVSAASTLDVWDMKNKDGDNLAWRLLSIGTLNLGSQLSLTNSWKSNVAIDTLTGSGKLSIEAGDNNGADNDPDNKIMVAIKDMDGYSGTIAATGKETDGSVYTTVTMGTTAGMGNKFGSASYEVEYAKLVLNGAGSNNANTAASAQQIGDLTLGKNATVEMIDGSYNIKTITVEKNSVATIHSQWDKNQFIGALLGEGELTLKRVRQTGYSAHTKAALYNLDGTSETTNFSGVIKLHNNANDNQGGLIVRGDTTGEKLQKAVIDFTGDYKAAFAFAKEDFAVVKGAAFVAPTADKLLDGAVAGLKGNNGNVYAAALTINTADSKSYDFGGNLTVDSLVKDGAGTQTLSGSSNTFTNGVEVKAGALVAASGAALGKAGTTTISGGSLEITDAKATITKSAADTNATVSCISGSADDVYGIGNSGYKIEDAKVELASDGATTIGNLLDGVELVNNGAGTVTAGNADNVLSAINADAGNVDIVNAKAQSLSSLSIGAGKTVGIYSAASAPADPTSADEATVTTGNLTAGAGATLNANLVLSDGATVKLAAALTMGSSVTLGEGMTLSGDLVSTIKGMSEDGTVDLFTGVDALYLGGSTVASGALDATSGEYLKTYFNFDDQRDYYLGYSDRKVYAGVISIPEPTTATLSLLALAALAARRRRR